MNKTQINYPISPNPWEVIFPAPVPWEGIGDMLGGGARENVISILSFDLPIPHAAGEGPQDGGRGGDGGGGLLHGDNHFGDSTGASRRGRVTFVFCSS